MEKWTIDNHCDWLKNKFHDCNRIGCDNCNNLLLDGNDMISAINQMNDNKELYGLDSFLDWSDTKWDKLSSEDPMYEENFELWLFGSSERFFILMSEWIENVIN